LHQLFIRDFQDQAMPPSSEPPQPHPLQPVLDDAEAELRRRLHEACVAEAKGVSTESTQEIRRLEDALLAAAVAAQQTITVRRHMKSHAPEERERPISINQAGDAGKTADSRPEKTRDDESMTGEQHERPDTRVREFKDNKGHPWRAWPVIPGQSRASASGRNFLGNFQEGWICFEGMDSTARRRLPHRQTKWAGVTDDELQHLLAQAIDAPGRETYRKNKS
jgi:hypothetical protein